MLISLFWYVVAPLELLTVRVMVATGDVFLSETSTLTTTTTQASSQVPLSSWVMANWKRRRYVSEARKAMTTKRRLRLAKDVSQLSFINDSTQTIPRREISSTTRSWNELPLLNNFSIVCPTPTTLPPHWDEDTLTSMQVYGYGTLAVLIISLCSVAGMFYLPMLRWSAYRHVITGFISFGLGVMVGDAILHLIPEALLITHTMESNPYILWRCLAVMGTIYALFTFETLMELTHRQDEPSHRCPRRHSHSHIPFPEDILLRKGSPSFMAKISSSDLSSHHFESMASESESTEQEKPRQVRKVEFHGEPHNQASSRWKTLALVIILGDTIHNFGDGLSVGAAFTSGAKSGISTSLAIFCHELPHEFGDFVILMTTGLSFRQAMVANLGSAITAFAGLYAGIALGDNKSARQWIFAFTAGTFLYIAIGDMLPELRNHNKNIGVFMVQNLCMFLGMGLMLILTFYEHNMYLFA